MLFFFFLFKQKTAYEMRISDWSSDVCSSDLIERTAASARGIIDGDGRNAVSEVSGAARELKVAIGEARLTIADIGRQTDAIGTRTLPTVNATMQSLPETAESLDALVRQIRQNPRQPIGQDSGKAPELPQSNRTSPGPALALW